MIAALPVVRSRPEAAAPPTRALSRGEWAAGGVALVLGVIHQVMAPNSGTDLAAQLARASFARSAPLTPVDLSWYSGVHPFGYSLLSPWIMAVLGVGLSGILAAVGGAVLFARLLRNERFPVSAAVLGAVFFVADIASGRTTFALSAVALLAALLLRERRGWAIFFSLLTALLSPVGAAFLALIAAVLVIHRRPGGWSLALCSTGPTLILAVLFPGGGTQPFSTSSAIAGLVAAGVVALMTQAPMVRTGALLYGGAVVFFAVHSDPFGSNILRLGLLVAAPLVIATHGRTSVAVVMAVIGLCYWQVGPTLADLRADPGPELAALTTHLAAWGSARVEVVAPRDHRESWTVAERVPLARGWGRQIDERDNPLFYDGTLTAPSYLAWLQRHGVDHVAVPRRSAVDLGSTREAALLRRPITGLKRIWSDRDWTVYTVQSAHPLVAAPARVVSSTPTTVRLSSPSAGSVHLVIRWSPWLTVTGPACVSRDGDGVAVRFVSPGTVVVGSGLLPHGHC